MSRATISEIRVPAGDITLAGDLGLPPKPLGVVLFAHGSGSSRFSPRNREVAAHLQEAGFATLLADLLTEEEDEEDRRTAHLRFDIGLLSDRVVASVDWIRSFDQTVGLPIGCFGASTGAAAALVTAALRPVEVEAVVSRGGRPDLAGSALLEVRAPTLLIVGGHDPEVLELNRGAMAEVAAECRLEVVEGATHLFEEPGALDEVARLAAGWFTRFLRR